MKLSKEQQKYKDALKRVCQLCHTRAWRLVCDHDHDTELMRGFVCDVCNLHLIPAGERRPKMVSQDVRSYLTTPPLGSHGWRYANKLTDYYIGNRDNFTYRELCYQNETIAQIRTTWENQEQLTGVATSTVEMMGKTIVIHQDGWDEDALKRLILKRLTALRAAQ